METYVSTDVEADGPIPGPHSMLSFGSAAYQSDKKLLGTFFVNLQTLPGAQGDPKTLAWWQSKPDAWKACRQNLEAPEVAMTRYVAWLKTLPGKPVFVGYPAAYDFMFVYWYLIRFTGTSPFSHSALDIKTYAMACSTKAIASALRKTCRGNGLIPSATLMSHWMMRLSRAHSSAICSPIAAVKEYQIKDPISHQDVL